MCAIGKLQVLCNKFICIEVKKCLHNCNLGNILVIDSSVLKNLQFLFN
jgi:hypothetical protein